MERYGALSVGYLGDGHTVHVRHDGWRAAERQTQGYTFTDLQPFRQETSRLGYAYQMEKLRLDSEFVYTQYDQGVDEEAIRIGALAAGAELDLNARWTLLAQQQVTVLGDRRLHETTGDLFTTSVGARYQAAKSLFFEAVETLRWSGDNATRVGIRSQLSDRHTFYVQERFTQEQGRQSATTVLGGEELFGEDKSGRAYGEYQLETGTAGPQNRTVVGLGKRWLLSKRLTLDAAYERSQTSSQVPGATSRDALSSGVAWSPIRPMKLSGRYEFPVGGP